MLCLVLEYAADQGELPPFTREHPGSSIDLMSEPAAEGAADTRSALMLVRGAPWPAIQQFVAGLAQRQAPVSTFRTDPSAGLWFGRATFRPSALSAPSARAVASLLDLVGPPWIHIEHGVVHLRARLKEPSQAEDLLHLAEESLRASGVEAQVVVQEVSPKDHSVWESLVQHGIGLSL